MRKKLRFIVTFLVIFFSLALKVDAMKNNLEDVKLEDPCLNDGSCTIVCSYKNVKFMSGSEDYLGAWIYVTDYGNSYKYMVAFDRWYYATGHSQDNESSSNSPFGDFVLTPYDDLASESLTCPKYGTSCNNNTNRSLISRATYDDLINEGVCPDISYISFSAANTTVCFESESNDSNVLNSGKTYCEYLNYDNVKTGSSTSTGNDYCCPRQHSFEIQHEFDKIDYNDLSEYLNLDNGKTLTEKFRDYVDSKFQTNSSGDRYYLYTEPSLSSELDNAEPVIRLFGYELNESHFNGSEHNNRILNSICSNMSAQFNDSSNDMKDILTNVSNGLLEYNHYLYINNEVKDYLLHWESYNNFNNRLLEKYDKLVNGENGLLNYCKEAGYDISDDMENLMSTDSIKSGIANTFNEIIISPSLNVGICSDYLGLVSTTGSPAYFIDLIYDIVKYLSVIIVIVLSVFDVIKVMVSSDADKKTKEVLIRIIIRVVILIAILIIPTIIDLVGNMFGIEDILCGIG